jgi:hypothetical protein
MMAVSVSSIACRTAFAAQSPSAIRLAFAWGGALARDDKYRWSRQLLHGAGRRGVQ